LTPEKAAYLNKVRALAVRLAERAGVTKPKVVYTEYDWAHDKALVVRKVFLPRGLDIVTSVRVDAELVDGRDESYALDDLLPVEEARYALVNLLMHRTPYVRPRLPR
jgi:hypothetical protein